MKRMQDMHGEARGRVWRVTFLVCALALLCTGCVGRNFTMGEELEQEKTARGYLEAYFQQKGMKAKIKELEIVGSHFERPQDGYDLTDFCDGYFETNGESHEFYVNVRTGQVYTDERKQEVQDILAAYYLESLGLEPTVYVADPEALFGLYVPETEGSSYTKTLDWMIPVEDDLDLQEYVRETLAAGDAFYETKIYEVGAPILENTINPTGLDLGQEYVVTITECDEGVTELFQEDTFPDRIDFLLHQKGVVKLVQEREEADQQATDDDMTSVENEPVLTYAHFSTEDAFGPVGVLYCDTYHGVHFDSAEEALQIRQDGSIWNVTGVEEAAPICYLYVNDLSQVDGEAIAATHASNYLKEMYDENYWRETMDGRYLLCEDFFYTLKTEPEYRPREVRSGSIFLFGDAVNDIPKEQWRRKGEN